MTDWVNTIGKSLDQVGGRKLKEKCLNKEREGKIVNESKNHTASAAVTDDIDFDGGIAFS